MSLLDRLNRVLQYSRLTSEIEARKRRLLTASEKDQQRYESELRDLRQQVRALQSL